MPADTEVAGLSVVVSAEVAQAMKALDGMSRQFEDTSLVAQQASDIQEASFVEVEKVMDNDLKQHQKHSEGVMASLKKIGLVWTAITGAAIGGIYGLLRASSYGSLYFSQWGAIIKDVANTFIRPILPLLNDLTNAAKKMGETFKIVAGEMGIWKGVSAAISLGISELWDWIGKLDLKWKILIGVFAAVVLAGVSLVLILTGQFGLVLAIGLVIAAVILFKDKIGWLIDKLVGAAGAAKDFVDKGLKYIVTYLSDLTWPAISNPFDLDYLEGIADWVLSVLGLKSGHTWNITWPTISNPFDFGTGESSWVSVLPSWVQKVLGIGAHVWNITWSTISNPFDFGTGESSWVSVLPSWVQKVLGIGAHVWNITWPTISNPFAGITWCSLIPGWVASVLHICDDTAVAPVITWPEISDPFAGVFDTITDFAGDAADVGGTLIDNLVSGINTGMSSLEEAVSGITETLGGIGGSGSGGTGTGGTGGTSPGNEEETRENMGLAYYGTQTAAQEFLGDDTYFWQFFKDEVPVHFGTMGWLRAAWDDVYELQKDWDDTWTMFENLGGYSWFWIGDGDNARHRLYFNVSDGSLIPSSEVTSLEGGEFGETPTEVPEYAKGGYVPSTSNALVHSGEYVVPRSGTLIKEGGMPDVTINLTVNNGTQKDSRALADEISRILSTEIRRLVKT